MRFEVECFENVDAFGRNGATPYRGPGFDAAFPFHTAPLRRVANLTVEADTSMGAADEAFVIANAPWEPQDAEGRTWPHHQVRSMCSTDVVVVHTPDGTVAYGCLSVGWATLPQLPLNVVAAL